MIEQDRDRERLDEKDVDTRWPLARRATRDVTSVE
jgi:hypothetical protein